MKQGKNHALISVTTKALWRRRLASLLLAAVAAAGVLAAIVLQNLTARQEDALRATIENATISCTVTNAKGTDSGRLSMLSIFVDMLTGRRRARGCYLDDYVKNVRALAEETIAVPELKLRRILSTDSDPALSPVNGASVEFFEGWTEESLQGAELLCLVPPDMVSDDGYFYISPDGTLRVCLRIIGTVSNGPGSTIYCPFYMPWEEGTSISILTDSCSFDIRDNQRLEACKAEIYAWFIEPDLNAQYDGFTFGVLVHDELYLKSLAEIQSNLSMLHLLLPVLIVLFGGIGFFAGYLSTRGRTKEIAVMRCVGLSKGRVFSLILYELSLLSIIGVLFGLTAGFLLEGGLSLEALGVAALITGVFILGSSVAALRVASVNVMQLMKVED